MTDMAPPNRPQSHDAAFSQGSDTNQSGVCPECGDGIDPDANGCCGSCGWKPFPEGKRSSEKSVATPPGIYRTIVADPPWPYSDPGGSLSATPAHRPNSFRSNVGSEARYGSMSIEDLCALQPPAADDAHLYLWTTNAFMVEAHEVARTWGFAPKTICTWGKVKPDGTPSMKTGHYFRGATEHVVFCVRGRLPFPKDKPTPTLWLWPRNAHSVKPDTFYDVVERLSPGPYLEMFARRRRIGWDVWGNEVDSDLEVVA